VSVTARAVAIDREFFCAECISPVRLEVFATFVALFKNPVFIFSKVYNPPVIREDYAAHG